MNRAFFVLLIVALASVTSMCFAGSNRVLIGAPPDYKAVMINGVEHMSGEVYLPKTADTTALASFGFRDFEFIGRSVRYVRMHAIWPASVDNDALPEQVMGFKYDTDPNKKIEYYDGPEFAGVPQSCGTGGYVYNNSHVYYAPVSNTSNYNYGYSGTPDPYCSWQHRFNPDAYYYKTRSPTTLTPTTIGSTPSNRFVKRKCAYEGHYPYR